MFLTKVLEERESKFNGHIKVSRSLGFGTYIQAGGLTQSGGIVGVVWKPTLKKLKSQISNLKTCLILGLGGGTAAKYVRLFWPGAKIIGIDIDPVMIELGKKYLGLDQIGIDIKIADAENFVSRHITIPDRFDLILVDLYQGDKYPEKFETENYIHLVRRLLASTGIAIFNRLYYGDKRPDAVKFGNKLKKVFSKVEWFYPEVNLMFLCNS